MDIRSRFGSSSSLLTLTSLPHSSWLPPSSSPKKNKKSLIRPRCSSNKENGDYDNNNNNNNSGDKSSTDWDKAWSKFKKQGKKTTVSKFNPNKYVSWNPRRSEYPLSEEVDPIKRVEKSNLMLWTSPRFTLGGAIVIVTFLLVYTLLVRERMEGKELIEIEDDAPEFTLAEIIKMESFYKEMGEMTLSLEFCQEVATKFSCSKRRKGKPAIRCEQVQNWFDDKQKKSLAKITMSPVHEDIYRSSEFSTVDYTQESRQKSKAERIAGLPELIFEAKSGKDDGWYDVATFLNYRITYHGELEVRCRFAGFRHDHDEWVNVKRGVRERSIPLEPSECGRVKVGDSVLCFRMDEILDIYCDAQIVDIERRLHDDSCCSCVFVVRYHLDLAEEQVDLTRICCRPT